MTNRYDRYYDSRPKPNDERNDAQRDRDRILFCSAFRRLSSVTQVVAPNELHTIHNRLTHSLKVAQIGKGLADRLIKKYEKEREIFNEVGGLDPFVVEAAGLAHDLGHPPFGHVAETELNALVSRGLDLSNSAELEDDANRDPGSSDSRAESSKKIPGLADGFEGNAQTFRIVTTLAARFYDKDKRGLDLTRATLCAILKYPWTRGMENEKRKYKKWGSYNSEQESLVWARMIAPEGNEIKSLEAALMDWADDIAYAVHDLEDFYRAGLIPLDRLVHSPSERDRFLSKEIERQRRDYGAVDEADLKQRFHHLMRILPFVGPFRGTHHERAMLRAFTSLLISQYMDTDAAVKLGGMGWNDKPLFIEPWAEMEVRLLKGLTWFYVIHSQALVLWPTEFDGLRG